MGDLLDHRLGELLGRPVSLLGLGYPLLAGLGLATFVLLVLRSDAGGRPRLDRRESLALLVALPGALFGAIALVALKDWLLGWQGVPTRAGGVAFQGAQLAGLGVAGAMAVVLRRRPWNLLDRMALFAPLGHALGRLGCFHAGCCHGAPTELPWGLRHPVGSLTHEQQVTAGVLAADALGSLPVHPVQLIECLGLLVLFVGLWRLSPAWRERPGWLLGAYLIAYAALRLGLEPLRGDDLVRGVLGWWSPGRVASLVGLVLGLALMRLSRGSVGRPSRSSA
ncbi:MAG: prolipoprotein diacylglyceryl transferase family protein [Acidobacteriota bacterium]